MSRAPGRWRGWSLRARLTAFAAVLVALALTGGAFALAAVVSSSRVAALDEVVRDRAWLVAQLATSDQVPDVLPVAEPGEVAQLLDGPGEVLASSATASRTLPVVPAGEVAALRAEAGGPPSGVDDVLVRTTEHSAYDASARVAAVPATWRGERVTAVASVPMREVEGVVGALRLSLAVVVPLSTLLVAGVVWVVLGRALRPVEELRRGADEIARSGGPGSLPVPRADDELGALARTLNAMLDSLRSAVARQRSFVGDAAHELRSPVAALRAAVDVAREHPDAYTAAELAADLEGEVARLQALVDDLLVLARLGARPVAPVDLDLGLLAREAAASTAGSEAVVVGAGHARAEPAGVARVLRNLLENAVRHARSRVEVTVTDGRVVVDDDGPGVAPEDRERVFERFTRLDEARHRDAGGTGLGLAIARETARELGGDVLLDASALGGLRAEVRLPAR